MCHSRRETCWCGLRLAWGSNNGCGTESLHSMLCCCGHLAVAIVLQSVYSSGMLCEESDTETFFLC